MTREQQEQIISLRANGEGYKKIAAALGLSVNTIKSFCRRYEAAYVQQFEESHVRQFEESYIQRTEDAYVRQPEESYIQRTEDGRYEEAQCTAAKDDRLGEGGLPFTENAKMPLSEKNPRCPRCNNPIQSVEGRRKRLFCSDACRVAYWRTRATPIKRRTCLGCGEPLLGNDLHRKFCSHSCYINFRFGKVRSGGHNGKSIWKGTEPSAPGRSA